ncbi:MAG TPA: HAMP domain-containing protein, partial [Spirochaetota bacterium]|nr:HAMP domain-containing protein [Spirochaetota bacterium]
MLKFEKTYLFLKFTLIISCCLIVILIIVGRFLFSLEEKNLIDEKIKNSEMLTDLMAKISGYYIEKFSFYSLDENTKRFQSENSSKTDILSVIVYDTDEKQLNPSGIRHDLIKEEKKYWLVKEADCIYKTSSNVSKKVGKAVIVFSLKGVYEKIDKTRSIYTVVMVLTIIILDIIVALLLFFVVTNPLNILTMAAKQIASGNFIDSVNLKSKDEIGILSENIIKMSKELKKNFL